MKMKTDINTIAEGLKYMQSKLSGTFVIQYVKYDRKWQFAPSTSAKSEKIKCKTFEQMIRKGHDYMAKKFKKKFGYSYKDDFNKDNRILELEAIIKQLKKSSKMTVFNTSEDELKLNAMKSLPTFELASDFMKENDKKTPKNSVKKDVHKEMLKCYKGIIIHKEGDYFPEDFGFDDNYKVEIKLLKDIDTWAELDKKDYKTQYTNAYQRIAYRKRKNK
jgi:hypothetical protein